MQNELSTRPKGSPKEAGDVEAADEKTGEQDRKEKGVKREERLRKKSKNLSRCRRRRGKEMVRLRVLMVNK